MSPNQHSAVKQYASVGLETGVVAADPHALIVLLYDGAIEALARARRHMECGETAQKSENLNKAVNIIAEGLKASLDVKAGGKVAENLAALYDFMAERLLVANQHNRVEIVAEVADLLRELGEAWKSIGKRPAHAATHGGGAQPAAPQAPVQPTMPAAHRPVPTGITAPQVAPGAAVNTGSAGEGPGEAQASNRVARFYRSL